MSEILDRLFTDGQEDSPKYKLLEKLLDAKEGLNLKTELNDREIRAFSVGERINQIFKDRLKIDLGIDELLDIVQERKVSRKRKGRQEIIQAVINTEEIPDMYKSRLKKVLGI